ETAVTGNAGMGGGTAALNCSQGGSIARFGPIDRGVSGLRVLATWPCARRSRGPEEARIASQHIWSWAEKRKDRGHILRLRLEVGIPGPSSLESPNQGAKRARKSPSLTSS